MTYHRKIYVKISPTGNNISFTEWKNLPYSVLLGLTPPWNIFITTQCNGWESSSVLINPKSLIIHTETMMRHRLF